jgi:hypothetical protein
MDNELQSEFGCIQKIRFGGMNVTLSDSDNNKIEIPLCDKCNELKSPIIGKNAFIFICLDCEG